MGGLGARGEAGMGRCNEKNKGKGSGDEQTGRGGWLLGWRRGAGSPSPRRVPISRLVNRKRGRRASRGQACGWVRAKAPAGHEAPAGNNFEFRIFDHALGAGQGARRTRPAALEAMARDHEKETDIPSRVRIFSWSCTARGSRGQGPDTPGAHTRAWRMRGCGHERGPRGDGKRGRRATVRHGGRGENKRGKRSKRDEGTRGTGGGERRGRVNRRGTRCAFVHGAECA